MASIEKRGKNSFRLIVEAGYNEFGKRVKRYKTITVSGIREAEKELVKFRSEVESGQYVVPKKWRSQPLLKSGANCTVKNTSNKKL